jgi:serine protease inhibitor
MNAKFFLIATRRSGWVEALLASISRGGLGPTGLVGHGCPSPPVWKAVVSRCARWFVALLFLNGLNVIAALPPDQEKLAAANAGFAFGLLKQIVQQQPATNVFISPYSASVVLEMIANGAAGKTKEEMDRVLGVGGLTEDRLNQACKEMDASIRSAQSNVVLTLANSIWYRPGVELKPEFSAANRDYFGAALNALDFTDPRSAGVMNRWAEQNTQGKIKRIVEPPIPGSFQLFLANAIYFKGTWLTQFDKKETRQRPFHLTSGSQKNVPMMQQKGHFLYQEGNGFQAIQLPYAGKRLGMFVLLPQTNSSLEKLLASFDGSSWRNVILPKFTSQEGMIALPRFKLEYEVKLKQMLRAMGMKLAFERSADFSGMSSTALYVDEVKQMSFVEVNEEGTEAAAVTVGGIKATSVRVEPKPFQMIVDRPFLFLIHDMQTSSVLFLGALSEPRNGD